MGCSAAFSVKTCTKSLGFMLYMLAEEIPNSSIVTAASNF